MDKLIADDDRSASVGKKWHRRHHRDFSVENTVFRLKWPHVRKPLDAKRDFKLRRANIFTIL